MFDILFLVCSCWWFAIACFIVCYVMLFVVMYVILYALPFPLWYCFLLLHGFLHGVVSGCVLLFFVACLYYCEIRLEKRQNTIEIIANQS